MKMILSKGYMKMTRDHMLCYIKAILKDII